MSDSENLGAVVAHHPVDRRRRGLVALGAIVVGAPVAVFGVLAMIAGDGAPNPVNGAVPGFVVGIGIGLVGVAVWQGWLFATRAGERYTLYTEGLEHAYGGKRRAVRWDGVRSATRQEKDTALARTFGGNLVCRLELADGGKPLVVNGLAANAAQLIDAVWLAVPATVRAD